MGIYIGFSGHCWIGPIVMMGSHKGWGREGRRDEWEVVLSVWKGNGKKEQLSQKNVNNM